MGLFSFLSRTGENPGPFEGLSADSSAILSTPFSDGVSVTASKTFSKNFQIMHSFGMGQGTNYNMTALYAGDRSMLQGSVDNGGNVSGRVNVVPTEHVSLKAAFEMDAASGGLNLRGDVDLAGADFNLNSMYSTQGDLVSVGYLQNVTSSVAVGGEGLYIGAKRMSLLALGARHSTPVTSASVTVNSQRTGAVALAAAVSANSRAAVKLSVDSRSWQTDAVAGIQVNYPRAVVKATLGTKGRVSTTVKARRYHHVLSPGVAVEIMGGGDWKKGQARCGVGVRLSSV
ncbi:eukaryotic porin/Tom40 [Kipferlia bialata]|uniref:Eukaryotic porin/Tom40 n=1 Tax=Kipferlia bialata TaxID=797122 RepID=A0A9K3CXJ5_9EUKA|nr:eukaryotic porin/Tom40 [Kipferlia bialata]|eukprot:g5521.t1